MFPNRSGKSPSNKPRRLALLCTTLSLTVAGAQSAPMQEPAAPAPAVAKAPPVPLLWKVSDEDNSVYLLGSFHLLKPDDYPLSADVDAAFADAERLAFEIPPEELGSPTLAMQMGQAALRTDGTRLDSELPEDTVASLDAWATANAATLQQMGMTPQALQMFEPWFAGLMVTIVEMTKFGLDPKLGLDAHFAEKAKQANKPTAGFETGLEQIAFLDGMDKVEQLQFLQEALKSGEEGPAAIEKLHAAWRNGDTATMWDEMAREMREQFPKLYERINVARNDAWVPKIAERLEQPGTDDTLVVVGALHLIGEDGVVEKLRVQGYDVERVCSACEAKD